MTDIEDAKRAQRHYLKEMLSQRNQHPEKIAEIDANLTETFSRQVAVMALDMSGFSRLTAHHGVIHFLAMIHKMEQAATPAVEGNGGQVVKQEADNLFAVFPNAQLALEAALDIRRATSAMNMVLADDLKIRVSIGIGFGQTLLLDGQDFFGHEVNVACKLGEDLAKADEILLTDAAYQSLPGSDYEFTRAEFAIGAMDFKAWRYQGRMFSQTMSSHFMQGLTTQLPNMPKKT
jgi:adenylate cyclase